VPASDEDVGTIARAHGDGMLQSDGDDRLLETLDSVRINGAASRGIVI
jgi:hypothetical protein